MKVLKHIEMHLEGVGEITTPFNETITTPVSQSISIVENFGNKYILIHFKRIAEPDSIDIIDSYSIEEWNSPERETLFIPQIEEWVKENLKEI